jgi:hypothetical protein
MSTARNRFGVSILVGFVLTVLCHVGTPVAAAGDADFAAALAGDDGMGGIERIISAASARTQVAIGLGAGVPLLIVGFMVRRRIYADV